MSNAEMANHIKDILMYKSAMGMGYSGGSKTKNPKKVRSGQAAVSKNPWIHFLKSYGVSIADFKDLPPKEKKSAREDYCWWLDQSRDYYPDLKSSVCNGKKRVRKSSVRRKAPGSKTAKKLPPCKRGKVRRPIKPYTTKNGTRVTRRCQKKLVRGRGYDSSDEYY